MSQQSQVVTLWNGHEIERRIYQMCEWHRPEIISYLVAGHTRSFIYHELFGYNHEFFNTDKARLLAIERQFRIYVSSLFPNVSMLVNSDGTLSLQRSEYETNTMTRRTVVYVIGPECETPPLKIGVSSYVDERLKTLQIGCPSKLVVLFSLAHEMAFQIEKRAHTILSRHRTDGEWFDVDLAIASLCIQNAASIIDAGTQ